MGSSFERETTVFCPKARVTSTAYETRNGYPTLALKAPQPTLKELAELILHHLAQNPEQLADFMGQTGLSPDALRGSVGSSSLARGLLDYLVHNESLLLAFCAGNALQPDTVMRVWAKLNPDG
jgi:hypothetical protein